MSGKLAEVGQHLATTRELGVVVAAMRGIAAARLQEARQQLDGVRAYAETLGAAIGEALALLPEPQRPSADTTAGAHTLVLALCAEQGFVGGFNERVLDAAQGLLGGGAQLWLLGERGELGARERELAVDWTAPMAVHLDEVPALAGRLSEALYSRLGAGATQRVALVHGQPGHGEVQARSLLPFDYSRFAVSRRAQAPHVTLAPPRLIADLADEYLYAELCEALVLSFAAENEARMQAMVAAQGNVEERRNTLLAEFRRVRQDEITEEIVELSASRL